MLRNEADLSTRACARNTGFCRLPGRDRLMPGPLPDPGQGAEQSPQWTAEGRLPARPERTVEFPRKLDCNSLAEGWNTTNEL